MLARRPHPSLALAACLTALTACASWKPLPLPARDLTPQLAALESAGVDERLYIDAMLGGILRLQGRYDEALAVIERALSVGGEAKIAAKVGNKLRLKRGEILTDLGRYAEAKADYEAVLSSIEDPMNRAGPYRGFFLVGLARAESKLGNDDRAAELLVEARRSIAEISDDHWALVEPLSATAELALKLGATDEALGAAEHAGVRESARWAGRVCVL